MANTNNKQNAAPTPQRTKAEKLFREGLALFEGDGVEKDERGGASLIAEAAELGLQEAQDWIDDYTFDDDAGTQGVS